MRVLLLSLFLNSDAQIVYADWTRFDALRDFVQDLMRVAAVLTDDMNRCADVRFAETPKVRRSVRDHTGQCVDRVQHFDDLVLFVFGRALHQHLSRALDQRHHTANDETADDDAANGVGRRPAPVLHQQRRDDDADAAQCVSENVQINGKNVVIRNTARRTRAAI